MPGLEIETVAALDPATRRLAVALVDAAAEADGRRPLSDESWLSLVSAGTPSDLADDRAVHLLCRLDHGNRRGGELGRRLEGPPLVGYGVLQETPTEGTWAVETAVHPAGRAAAPGVGARLLDAAVDAATRGGAARLRLWVHDATGDQPKAAQAEERGFAAERELLQLRVVLPLPPETVAAGPALDIRAFRPGADDAAWLAANNSAFADHPEQGGWDANDLRRRVEEPWFDAEGFLVHESDGQLAGFCWTKVHRDTTPPMGEIYAVGVLPAFRGSGFGRALTVAGLAHLAGRGLTTGMLYVDGSNRPALSLYRSLGFTLHHADRAYVLEIGGAGPGPSATRRSASDA